MYDFTAVVAGPLTTLPVVEKTDPWQGQGKLFDARLYPIVQPLWVQVLARAT